MVQVAQAPRSAAEEASAAPITSRPNAPDVGPTASGRSLLLLAALSLLPLLMFAVSAYNQRQAALLNSEVAVRRTIQILEEHALRVFESQRLIIDQTDQYLGEMTWDAIRASEDVHRFLRETAEGSPHVDGLWLVPPDGRTANSADFFPFPDVSVTDRIYFQTLQERDELHFGEMIVGRTKGTFNFNLSRRRSPRDTFNGVILVTSSLAYFTDFWEQASEGEFVAGIFREDGEILVRHPHLDELPRRLPEDSQMLDKLQIADDGIYHSISSLDGNDRIYGYSRIGDTPLFIGYGVPNDQVLANWRSEMLRMGLVALIATALLAIAGTTIFRQNRSLGATALSWRRAAKELEQEVGRRLRAEDVATERQHLLDEVRALTAQRQIILENISEGVVALDARGCIIYANRDATNLLGPFRLGEQAFKSLVTDGRILAADGSGLEPDHGPDQGPLRGDHLAESEFTVRLANGDHVACAFRGGAIYGVDGQPDGAVLTFWDISERKQEANRKELLMRELDHRVRNMLATIMAMIRISNEPHQSKQEFVAALSGRIGAMARTQGVLSEGEWKGATIGRIVDDEVASAADKRKLVLRGDRNVLLPPKEAADLALALHELTTNATKHGAWSAPEGSVTLTWQTASSTEGQNLHVEWQESGGPVIAAVPKRKGFGSTLMRGLFAGKGSVSLEYAPEGLLCTINIALSGERRNIHTTEPLTPNATVGRDETSLQGIRVLVVEDEALVRLDLLDILREAGALIVGEAGSLQEAIDMSKMTHFDVAILDRNLAGSSSMPLAERVAMRGAGIVFVSGYRPDEKELALKDSLHVHLQKPISAQSLVSAVRAVFASRR
jgi:two-component sensor histidine kinase/PAS domain-containing protein